MNENTNTGMIAVVVVLVILIVSAIWWLASTPVAPQANQTTVVTPASEPAPVNVDTPVQDKNTETNTYNTTNTTNSTNTMQVASTTK